MELLCIEVAQDVTTSQHKTPNEGGRHYMFTGEFIHNVDSKNRIFVPSKFREELGETFMIARDIRKPILKVYSIDGWQEYLAPIKLQERKLAKRRCAICTEMRHRSHPILREEFSFPRPCLSMRRSTRKLILSVAVTIARFGLWITTELKLRVRTPRKSRQSLKSLDFEYYSERRPQGWAKR